MSGYTNVSYTTGSEQYGPDYIGESCGNGSGNIWCTGDGAGIGRGSGFGDGDRTGYGYGCCKKDINLSFAPCGTGHALCGGEGEGLAPGYCSANGSGQGHGTGSGIGNTDGRGYEISNW